MVFPALPYPVKEAGHGYLSKGDTSEVTQHFSLGVEVEQEIDLGRAGEGARGSSPGERKPCSAPDQVDLTLICAGSQGRGTEGSHRAGVLMDKAGACPNC